MQNHFREWQGEWARAVRSPGSTKDSLGPKILKRKRPVSTAVCFSPGMMRSRENETEPWLGFCLVTKPGSREQASCACVPGGSWNLRRGAEARRWVRHSKTVDQWIIGPEGVEEPLELGY